MIIFGLRIGTALLSTDFYGASGAEWRKTESSCTSFAYSEFHRLQQFFDIETRNLTALHSNTGHRLKYYLVQYLSMQ
jgi:hypothetical protein